MNEPAKGNNNNIWNWLIKRNINILEEKLKIDAPIKQLIPTGIEFWINIFTDFEDNIKGFWIKVHWSLLE